MVDLSPDRLPVAVIGAGPVGLAAAAHLAERSVPFVVVEAGDAAAAAVRAWSHIQLFSPWEFNTDPAARRLLAAAGWDEPDASALPTGGDLVKQYLQPLAELPTLAPTSATVPRSPPSAVWASTGCVPRAGNRRPSSCAWPQARNCSPVPSSMPPAPGVSPTTSEPTACPPTGSRRLPPGSTTVCPTSSEPTATSTPAATPSSSAPPLCGQHPACPGRAGRHRAGHHHHLGHPRCRSGRLLRRRQ